MYHKKRRKLENVFMKQSISQIKAKPKSTPSFVTQLHRLSEHE